MTAASRYLSHPTSMRDPISGEPPRRYLALWLPFLPIDRLRRHSGVPDDGMLVLVERQRNLICLAALDRGALGQGLRPGMPLAEARALVPNLVVREGDRAADAAALRACAEACQRFTPMVAINGEDALLLDITGCAHLLGGETGVVQALRRLMTRWGLRSRIAIASTPLAARAFSRFSAGGIIPAGEEALRAQDLPIAALEPEEETATGLLRAGLHWLGDLASRSTAALTARFGPALATRLAGILGQDDSRITPLRPLPEIMAERHFPEPLALMDSLMAVLGRLAGDVATMLEWRGEGGRTFEAEFYRADGEVRRLSIATAEPLRDPPVLIRLLRLKADTLTDPLDPGFGFDAIRLCVLRSEALAQRQDTLLRTRLEEEGDAALAGLVDRLTARFGAGNVLRLARHDTHDPARAGGLVPYLSADPGAVDAPPEPGNPPDRPLTLFARPQPVDVVAEVPDGPPLRFRWRRVLHEVTRAEGPERIAPEWWRLEDSFPTIRDYYRVEDPVGQRFWLFREGLYEAGAPPRWYVHGLFA